MNVNFNEDKVEIQTFESMAELKHFVEQYEHNFILDEDWANYYQAITINAEEKVSIGVAYNHQGIDPTTLIIQQPKQILIGFDKKIVGIDYTTKRIMFEKKLFSLFYNFIYVLELGFIVVLNELDINVIDSRGNTIWQCDGSDILAEYEVLGDKLRIKYMDDNEIVFSIKDGKVIA